MWGARLGHPLRAKRVHCKINYPRKGAPAAAACSRSVAERPRPKAGAPALPDTHLLHLLLRVSTRPHSLEGLRTLSLALEGMQIAIHRRAGRPGNTASHSLTSPALAAALAQVRGLGRVVSQLTMQSRAPAKGHCHGAAQSRTVICPHVPLHTCARV